MPRNSQGCSPKAPDSLPGKKGEWPFGELLALLPARPRELAPRGHSTYPPAKVWAGCLPSHPFHLLAMEKLDWAGPFRPQAVRGPGGPARALSESELAGTAWTALWMFALTSACEHGQRTSPLNLAFRFVLFVFMLFDFVRPHHLLRRGFSLHVPCHCPNSSLVY